MRRSRGFARRVRTKLFVFAARSARCGRCVRRSRGFARGFRTRPFFALSRLFIALARLFLALAYHFLGAQCLRESRIYRAKPMSFFARGGGDMAHCGGCFGGSRVRCAGCRGQQRPSAACTRLREGCFRLPRGFFGRFEPFCAAPETPGPDRTPFGPGRGMVGPGPERGGLDGEPMRSARQTLRSVFEPRGPAFEAARPCHADDRLNGRAERLNHCYRTKTATRHGR